MGDLPIELLVIIGCIGAIYWVCKKEDDFMSDDDDFERDTTHEYDSADGNDCLAIKMQCLALAAKSELGPDKTVEIATKYWDFIKYESDKK